MIIGTVREIKNHEYRVGLTPDNVKDYIRNGHQVIVETNAGLGANFTDQDYIDAGATIIDNPKDVFAKADIQVL